MNVEALLVSAGIVAISEIGDKTQLLALVLAARFRRPWPIIAGILIATLANHAGAALLGSMIQRIVPASGLRWVLALSFFAVALWALKPDELGDGDELPRGSAFGVLGVTAVAFFLAEMGDKTQVATVMLAARFDAVLSVTIGTTLGMLLANVPVVFLGDKVLKFVPLPWVRRIAAALFALLGALVLLGVGG
jgi:Ca2+/H+ antiporter, TMEM165/GDT1 family